MRFLITGANGFIGSYLSKYLLAHDHEVIALSRHFLPEIKSQLKGATFIEQDVLADSISTITVQADCIIHLASSNDIVSKSMEKGMILSVSGTKNILDLAIRNSIPRFIFFSTLQVYGTELKGTYNEESVLNPENDYALNHLFAEQYVEQYSRKYPLKCIVMRPSNIYGNFLSPKMNRWTLVPGCFIKEALDKGTITLMSSGNQLRNFISLAQLSSQTLWVAQNMKEKFDILNLVSNDYKRIIDVALLTLEMINKKLNVPVELIVKNNEPKSTNAFNFLHEKLIHKYKISVAEANMSQEIEDLITLLLETKNV